MKNIKDVCIPNIMSPGGHRLSWSNESSPKTLTCECRAGNASFQSSGTRTWPSGANQRRRAWRRSTHRSLHHSQRARLDYFDRIPGPLYLWKYPIIWLLVLGVQSGRSHYKMCFKPRIENNCVKLWLIEKWAWRKPMTRKPQDSPHVWSHSLQ